ncbi:MAG: DUF2199 domain-containing protein [Steroidobacteraceae bacterium]
MSLAIVCSTCGKTHEGIPTFGAKAPLSYYALPETERDSRCTLGTDNCIIDDEHFFVRGCLEIPVHDQGDPLVWGVWVSLSKASYDAWAAVFGQPKRSHVGPFFGWLDAWLKPYPDTMNLKCKVHLRDDGIRPLIELEPTEHPLAVEQVDGISMRRVADIHSIMVHERDA